MDYTTMTLKLPRAVITIVGEYHTECSTLTWRFVKNKVQQVDRNVQQNNWTVDSEAVRSRTKI